MDDERTKLNEQERKFFDELHALCVLYKASIYGVKDAEQEKVIEGYGFSNASDFHISVDGREFREVHVNHRSEWPKDSPAITSVQEDYMDLTLFLHRQP